MVELNLAVDVIKEAVTSGGVNSAYIQQGHTMSHYTYKESEVMKTVPDVIL